MLIHNLIYEEALRNNLLTNECNINLVLKKKVRRILLLKIGVKIISPENRSRRE